MRSTALTMLGTWVATTAQASAENAVEANVATDGSSTVVVLSSIAVIGTFASQLLYIKAQTNNTISKREFRFVGSAWAAVFSFFALIGWFLSYQLDFSGALLSSSGEIIWWACVVGLVGSLLLGCCHIWIFRKRQEIRKVEGDDSKRLFSLWGHLEPSHPGFRKSVFYAIAATGLAFVVPFIALVGFKIQTVSLIFSILICGLAAVRLYKFYHVILMTQMCALWLQVVLLCGLQCKEWYHAGLWSEHRISVAGMVFLIAIWAGNIISHWVYMRLDQPNARLVE